MATATAPSSLATPTPSDLAKQILNHSAPSYTFNFSPFLKRTYGHALDPNSTNKNDSADSNQQSSGHGGFNSLVCKHWLRALCKKGEHCEFLHEYNLRKMPECNFFVRNGYCSNGDECLYLHIDPQSKLPPCPWYERGFCPLGPECSKKHVRRKQICPYYMAGFCPDGRECKEGAHARWEKDEKLPEPIRKSDVVKEEPKREEPVGGGYGGYGGGGDDEGRDFGGGGGGGRFDGRGGGRGGFGGRGGRWRGRGDRKFRGGRGHH
ncbi:hypothetical protein Micbo1qcDRAFT_168001 [Microdochium bolleyi]|uniref:mRNA 3'-end-processing protein n=1 Tax=Microdochium bolleyi TaxID=196109 RepID=A0A136IPT0_9PEZI|nr:hypothetical protein Micbo1qcDRAFT_168001 [Microdochium bolleyi]